MPTLSKGSDTVTNSHPEHRDQADQDELRPNWLEVETSTEAHMVRRLATMLWKDGSMVLLAVSEKGVVCPAHDVDKLETLVESLNTLDIRGEEPQDGEYYSLHEQVIG